MIINSSNRTKARLMVLSYVTVGILIGVGLMNFISAKTTATRTARPSMVEKMDKELKFTPEQKIEAEKIYAAHQSKSREIFKVVKSQFDALMEDTRTKMKSVLTPEQAFKYDEGNKKRDAERAKQDAPQPAPSVTK